MDFGKEFEKYYVKHLGKGSLDIHNYSNHIESSLTPYILEEREMRATQIDIFSRLMRERILWVSGAVNQRMSDIVQAQMLFLDSVEQKDITLYINSPGGSVLCGLGIVDLMNYVSSDIVTTNLGMCASMGSVLLSSGTKGKRSSLRFSKTMLHQTSGGAGGNIQDARINMIEWEKTNKILFELLGSYCGKKAEQVMKDATRDLWLSADEALKYGIIDEVVKTKKKGN